MSERATGDLGPDEKRCPFCAEVIKKAAIKCRWCGSELAADQGLDTGSPGGSADSTSEARSSVESGDEGGGVHTEERAPSRSTLLTGGLLVLLVVVMAALALAVRQASKDAVAPDGELSSAAARAGIMAQAGRLAETAMSYRAAQADHDIAAAEKLMTPAMRTKYEKSLPAASSRATQAKQKVTVTAALSSLSGKEACTSDDCAAAIVSASQDRARVLLFVDQSVTAASSKQSVASPTWELLTLVKRGGGWLIDDMTSS